MRVHERWLITLSCCLVMLIGTLTMPISSHADTIYMQLGTLGSSLKGDYLPASVPDRNSSRGYRILLGKSFNEYFSVESYFMKINEQKKYKVGELSAIDTLFVDIFTFGMADTNIYMSVDTDVQSIGINSRLSYGRYYLKAGVTKWDAETHTSLPDKPTMSISYDGTGYHYGIGALFLRGERWSGFIDYGQYVSQDLSATGVGLGVQYSF